MAPSRKQAIKKAYRNRLNWIIVLVLLILTTVLSFPSTDYFAVSKLEVGEPSQRTIRVNERFRIPDWKRTEEQLSEARANVKPIFKNIPAKHEEILNNLRDDLKKLQNNNLNLESTDLPETSSDWNKVRNISVLVMKFLMDQGILKSRESLGPFENQTRAIVRTHSHGEGSNSGQVNKETVALDDLLDRFVSLDQVESQAGQMINSLYSGFKYDQLVIELVTRNAEPTVFFDKKEFREELKSVEEQVDPFYRTFRPGDAIVQAGETVTKYDIRTLKKLNNQKIRFQITGGISSLGIVLLAIGFVYVYISEFDPSLATEHNKLALAGSLTIIFLAIAKSVELLYPTLPESAEFGIPLAAASMLLTIMISEGFAFLLTVFLSMLTVSFFDFNFELFVMFLTGGLAGIFSIRKVERRVTLLQSGILLGAIQVTSVIFFYGVQTGTLLTREVGTMAFWSGINGVLIVPFVALGLLPFLENVFGITTNFKLLELADLNHPLLRKLFREAPGTFQHSIMLSNLCEQAAREIGANALLVRVGCYYHDLGKAENPTYFIENQTGIENPHDKLKPTLSVSILKAHVKKGSEIAHEKGLPEEIIDLIEQHHGTTLMKPFYHAALKEEETEVSRGEFQYPGPKPQSREAGICMLGDSVEAACRALENPSPQSIKERTTEIVHSKFNEGQLNECDLTLKDLNKIIETFTHVLTSVYHRRIEYPEEDDREEYKSLQGVESSPDEVMNENE